MKEIEFQVSACYYSPVIFKLPSPLGDEIVLTNECWDGHILVEHPMMNGFLGGLKETIVNPDLVFRSKISRKTLLYFKSFSDNKLKRFYLMAAVEMQSKKKKGFVKTAFLVYNLSKGGKLVWKKT